MKKAHLRNSYNGWRNSIIVLIILIGISIPIVNNFTKNNIQESINLNANINTDNYSYEFKDPIYYNGNIYMQYDIKLTNTHYIGKAPTLTVYDKDSNEIKNYNLLESSFIKIPIDDTIRKQELLYANIFENSSEPEDSWLFYRDNVVQYDNLDNLNEDNKSKAEKKNEVSYFIYLYNTYDYLHIPEIDNHGKVEEYFNKNINKNHKKLVNLSSIYIDKYKQMDNYLTYYKATKDQIDYVHNATNMDIKIVRFEEVKEQLENTLDKNNQLMVNTIKDYGLLTAEEIQYLQSKFTIIQLNTIYTNILNNPTQDYINKYKEQYKATLKVDPTALNNGSKEVLNETINN